MTTTWDSAKRRWTLENRGIDFAVDADRVFAGDRANWIDARFDYGETRMITAGWLDRRVVVIVWTQRDEDRHIISMRYCHAKEARKIRRTFGI